MLQFEFIVNQLLSQLNHCQAWIYSGQVKDTGTGDIVPVTILQSYSTIVAIMDLNGNMLELGKWSTTTSKQVTTWFNQTGGENRHLLDKLKNIEIKEVNCF